MGKVVGVETSVEGARFAEEAAGGVVGVLERVVVGLVLHDGVWWEVEDALEGVPYARGGGRVLRRPVPH